MTKRKFRNLKIRNLDKFVSLFSTSSSEIYAVSPILHPMSKTLKCLSFFSGALGLDIGLERAGIDVRLACEIDKPMMETIRTNKPNLPLIGDVRLYSADDILKESGLKKNQVDLIVGGPPCQAFSTAGRRLGMADERGNVFLKYLDLIEEIRPRYAVIENVRGLLSSTITIDIDDDAFRSLKVDPAKVKGSTMLYVKNRLENMGYQVTFNLYNAANFGTPQIRERVVIMCTLDKEPLPFLTPTHSESGQFGLPKWNTFKDAVKGLKGKQEFVKFSEKRLKYFQMLGPGQYWKHLPPNIQEEAMGNSFKLGGGKTGFFRRLSWDRPSPTVVTHPAMPATELGHPVEDRPLSVQEYKRIQQFPDEWIICGKLTDQYKQIGNAVPVGLGYAIGKCLTDHSKRITQPDFSTFQYSRYKFTSNLDFEKSISNHEKKLKHQLSLDLVD